MKKSSPAERELARKLYEQFNSYHEVARRLNRSDSVVRYWLNSDYKKQQIQRKLDWIKANPSKHKEHKQKHAQSSLGVSSQNARKALRRSRKHNTPEVVFLDGQWCEVDRKETYRVFGAYLLPKSERLLISQVYQEAKKLTEQTGIDHDVDHIQPLACGGEHLSINLQILTAEENNLKSSSFRPQDQVKLANRYFQNE